MARDDDVGDVGRDPRPSDALPSSKPTVVLLVACLMFSAWMGTQYVAFRLAYQRNLGDAAYVARIAVRPDHRGRGLAPAMLVDAFAQARSHGADRCYLSTDTRAGARGLYEKVGMEVASTWVNRAITL